MNSKAKGSEAEREVCRILTEAGFTNAHRNDQRYVGGHGNPDIDADGLEDYHIEVKRVERLNIAEAMRQAAADAFHRIPVIIHRRSREPWSVTLPMAEWLRLIQKDRAPCK